MKTFTFSYDETGEYRIKNFVITSNRLRNEIVKMRLTEDGHELTKELALRLCRIVYDDLIPEKCWVERITTDYKYNGIVVVIFSPEFPPINDFGEIETVFKHEIITGGKSVKG